MGDKAMLKNMSAYLALVLAALLISQTAEAKTYSDRSCRKDYKRLCPNTPISKCDLATMISQLSPACKAFVQKNQ